ncbi:HORMA domain-containing protein 1 [Sparganum proliferum]
MTLTMKLQYYESAPSDYLPKGFKADDSPDFVFAAGPVNVKMGLIETIGELSMATESLTLQKDPELQLLSQESADSTTPRKRRRICNVVNTPIPVVPR